MSETALTFEHVAKSFDNRDVLSDVTFSVEQGEIVALRGQKGCGKTTLLKLAAGILPPTSGNIRLLGENVVPGGKSIVYQTGVMLDCHGVYSRLTVRQYLAFFQRLYSLKKERVDEVIGLAGLIDRKNTLIKKLPDSFIYRISLARSILHRPSVLLLDEPTSHTDLETTEILRRVIVKSTGDGTAVLLTTSLREEAFALACRTGVISNGRIESWEEKEDVKTSEPFSPPQHLRIEKIPAKINDRIILFNPQELIYVESSDGASLIHTSGEEYPCPLTLSELEGKLKPFGFFRSHRSYIVNLQRVREVLPWTRNSYSLVLNDEKKTTIPLSKNSLKELESLLGM